MTHLKPSQLKNIYRHNYMNIAHALWETETILGLFVPSFDIVIRDSICAGNKLSVIHECSIYLT